ncbi:MAG: helix-turn-helix transcriptional regulator [Christensenellaceae bacterium]|nr:helix-turn-helix transcriptional regulator [Christensenellaceae bacterium]
MKIDIKVTYKNEKLKEIRKQKGLSQSQLAKLSDINVRTIQSYESGARNLNNANLLILLKLANALNCKIENLITDIDILEEFKKYNKNILD